jgi:hypothetical protein
LLPKANSQSGFPKLRHRNLLAHSKAHNYSRKLITKLLPKILPEICSPKLVPEAAPEQLSTIPKLVTNAVPKNAPESSSPKLSKIATENCSPKFLVNACPKVAIFQSKRRKNCPKLFLKLFLDSNYCSNAAILQI